MKKDLRDKLNLIKQKLKSIDDILHKGLGWLLIILCSLVIVAFLYKCFKTIQGEDILYSGDWVGFLVSLGLLAVGILSVYDRRKKEPD